MTATLLPIPEQQYFDDNGVPLAAGTVATYIPNTMTPSTTWQDPNQVTANSNPITLDAAGRAVIYGNGNYREIVKDSSGNTIYDQLTASYLPSAAISAALLPVTSAATTATAVSLLGIPGLINTAIANVSLLPGPAGPQGAAGSQGPQGPTGPQGESATTVFANVYTVTSERTWNQVYFNTTGVPMYVSVSAYSGGTDFSPLSFIVNGQTVDQTWSQSAGGATVHWVGGIVPNGAAYEITQSSWNSIQQWVETY